MKPETAAPDAEKVRAEAFRIVRDFWPGKFAGEHYLLVNAIAAALRTAHAAGREAGWQPIETAPRDGRWLLMVSNDHMHFYRVSWAQVPHGEVWWLAADGRYYGDGLFGGWIECPDFLPTAPAPQKDTAR